MQREWDKEAGTWKGARAGVNHEAIPDPLWIFGYGSLCWKPGDDLPHVENSVASLQGFKRRFFQLSADHRGTPQRPGLVATLLPSEGSEEVIGVAYRVDPARVETVIDTLDFREKGGYTRAIAPVQLKAKDCKQVVKALVYFADETNPNFAGSEIREDIDKIAQVIAGAHGPSGANAEYLFKLAEFTQKLGVKDDHLDALDKKVKALVQMERNKRESEPNGNFPA